MDWSSSDWKGAALAIVPDLAGEIEKAESPYFLWIELYRVFREAYNSTRDDALIGQIYGFAKWCLEQPRGERYEEDVKTCVCLCFYQNLPLLPAARDELGKWLQPEDFATLKLVFQFHCDDKVFGLIESQFSER
ncbi:hypothetical protein P12x_000370 [Tundrisphaera lichenicola]|uniref:hypothetical protein n=1 Tax=Tundrisphaera lichenicola TaxID=2029860 RepID=UPI003EB82BF8